jgi:hexosaminidase
MTRRLPFIVLVLLLSSPLLPASPVAGLNSSDSEPLNLLPEPKEVKLQEGEFRLGPRTRILVQLGHQEEDRIAAETLAEEVADHSGLKLDIVGTKASTKAAGGAIMLVRLQDASVRRFLASKGLRADSAVGQQGYLLFSDNSHLIVAANTGQGLFSGVQTLRQLLRPDGKDLICPAVAIRDWPNLESPASPANFTRDTVPQVAKQFRTPGA